MSVFTRFWHNLIRRLRPGAPLSAGEFERELSVARQERARLLGQLNDLQSEVERGVSTGQQEHHYLLAQLQELQVRVEQEAASAGVEKQALRGELTGLRTEVAHGLEAAHHEQQDLLGQLNGLRTEVGHGLEAARQEQQGLAGQLSGVQSQVEHGLAAARQEQQDLLGQLSGLKSEVEHGLEAARQEQQGLIGRLDGLQAGVEHGLSAVRQEQQALQARLTNLQSDVEREFSAVREDQRALLAQVGTLRVELEQVSRRDEELRGELQQRFDQIRVEREAASQEIRVLSASLADASARQESADTRINSLEIRLKEQRQEHDVALQQTLIRERRLARRLTAAMIVAAAAFLLGIAGGAINFWAVKNTTRLLAEVSQGIRDIQATIAGQSSAEVPASSPGATPAANGTPDLPAVSELPPPGAGSPSGEQHDADSGSSARQLPAPDFVASRSLPLADHTFRTRQDTRAFFEENAKQPGVVTLESGLQYREMISGAGRIPAAGDQVVVEYRAFRPDGTETDNSFKASLPTTFIVSEAIPALKEALLHMPEGAQWELYIPPNLAYPGTRKRGPLGFEPLILTVELISVHTAAPTQQH